MICKNCGKEFDDGNIFCPFCGEKVLKSSENSISESLLSEDDAEDEESLIAYQNSKVKHPKKKKAVLIAAIIIVLAALGAGGYYMYIQLFSEIEVDLSTVMETPEFTGEQGAGMVSTISIDKKKAGKLIASVNNKSRAGKLREFLKTVSYDADPQDGLSNKDKVTVKASYDRDFAKANRIRVIRSTKKVTVSGLNDAASSVYDDSVYNPESYESYYDDFVLPGSDQKYIDKSDCDELNYEYTEYAIWEIYARHGMIFDSEDASTYYNSLEWYVPTYTSQEFNKAWLNKYEKKNLAMLKKHCKENDWTVDIS